MVNVYLDDTKLQTLPIDIADFEEEVVFDEEIYGLVRKYPLDLTFVGDGYRYLLDKKKSGFCNRVSVRIEYFPNGSIQYPTVINGYLFVSDIEQDHTKKTMKCSIEDNNFGAIIKQNAKVPVDVRSVLTRNGETMSATTSFNLTMYTTGTGGNLATACVAYDISNVFEHVVKFLSDNELDFQSDYLTNLSDSEKIALLRGLEIRLPGNGYDQVIVTFEKLMTFLHKKYNLYFTIDTSGVTPTFRLEDESFFEGTSVVTIPYIKDCMETMDQEKLFATIEVGDSNAIKEFGTTYDLPYVEGIAFTEEEYFMDGQCNIDNPLDLVTEDIAYDTNLIEQTIANTTVDNDNLVFAVQYVASTSVAHKGTYILSDPTLTPKLYNEQLLNLNVINRFRMHNNVTLLLADGTSDEFRAEMTAVGTALATTNPIPYDDDSTAPNEDPGGNYDNTTYRYTAPDNGLYSFEHSVNYTFTSFTPANNGGFTTTSRVDITLRIAKYDSMGVLIEQKETNNIANLGAVGSFTKVGGATFYMNTGDYVVSWIEVDPIFGTFTGTLDEGSYFRSTFVFNGGGTIKEADPDGIKMIVLKFSRGVSSKEWRDITAQLYNGITINTNGFNNTLCWVKNVKRKILSGACEWELVTNLEEMNLWE